MSTHIASMCQRKWSIIPYYRAIIMNISFLVTLVLKIQACCILKFKKDNIEKLIIIITFLKGRLVYKKYLMY